MLDPVNFWAATSGFGSKKDPMAPFQNFSSNVARGYGSNFGGHGSQYGIGPTTGFQPSTSGTSSIMSDFLADQKYESDMAANALNAITNIRLGGLMPEPQAGGGGGGAPQQKKPSTSDRLWGLGGTIAGAAVTAGVGALV